MRDAEMMAFTVEECRERAAQVRRLADEAWDQRTAEDLRKLAEEYELEARELDEVKALHHCEPIALGVWVRGR